MSDVEVRIAEYALDGEVEINSWSVPLLHARELDGGKVALTIDRRMQIEVDAAHFDDVVWFIANVIAVCWGYSCHPQDDDFDRARFARVPHPSLAPIHRVELGPPT